MFIEVNKGERGDYMRFTVSGRVKGARREIERRERERERGGGEREILID